MPQTCGPFSGSCQDNLVALADQWQPLMLLASGASLLLMLATLVAVPLVVTRLPADYFSRDTRREPRGQRPAWLALLLAPAKNAVGFVLVIFGIIMLVTPGQGLLTLLVGLLLMNFPGKFRLERWLVSRPGVLAALNWLRRRTGHEEFKSPP